MKKLNETYGFTTEENTKVLYLVFKENSTMSLKEGIQRIKSGEFDFFNLQADLEDEKAVKDLLI
jgi:hypothetical protein